MEPDVQHLAGVTRRVVKSFSTEVSDLEPIMALLLDRQVIRPVPACP